MKFGTVKIWQVIFPFQDLMCPLGDFFVTYCPSRRKALEWNLHFSLDMGHVVCFMFFSEGFRRLHGYTPEV